MRVFIHDPNDDSDHELDAASVAEAIKEHINNLDDLDDAASTGDFRVWARAADAASWSIYVCRVAREVRYDVTVNATRETRLVEEADDE